MSQARLFYWKVATFLGATNHDEELRRPKCLAPWPLLLKRPDVQRYPDDTRRAPAKPPAQPVGMAESDMNKSSWQKPACTHSAHRRRCVLELGPQIPQQRCVCAQAVPRFTRLAKKQPPPGRGDGFRLALVTPPPKKRSHRDAGGGLIENERGPLQN